jgi:hypothetical protein
MPPVLMQIAKYFVAREVKELIPVVSFVLALLEVQAAACGLDGVRLDPG